ncbi:flavin reductase family protein [Sulfitobacter sp. W074]|uniref:flavin reductase family protein n=1 Tax=Sulfitobacter sp. W074 TaxID=2867026 RepID=UPI0021A768E9|nr:flavin reductase family protein [Sulfitobacter sp. W074]UWR39496.1 flavin reductase family protein [Sulfitobacter sp. W074]
MRIHLTDAGTVEMIEPKNFRALDVLVDPQPEEQLQKALRKIGAPEGDGCVRLSPDVLRFLSGQAGVTEWEDGFAAMFGYAAKAGWVDEAGRVRAHLTFAPAGQTVSCDDFKAAMRALPAGIAAITAKGETGDNGMIVSSLTSISAEPPMVGFFVHHSSSMLPALQDQGTFAANLLGRDNNDVLDSFVRNPQGEARFATGNWRRDSDRPARLMDALAYMECDIIHRYRIGTHILVVGRIRETACSAASPIINFNASTRVLADIAAE